MSKEDFSRVCPVENLTRPADSKKDGTNTELICPNDNRGGCGERFSALIKDDAPEEECPGTCPDCGTPLVLYWGDFFSFGFKMGARGFHETKCGMKRKREMTKRNEELGRTQWETNEPVKVSNPGRVLNPTPGGIYDPNSRFNKGRKKSD